MTNKPETTNAKLNWRFPRAFWVANTAELFERAAFYGMFIALALYLTREVGFTDVEAGYVAAGFSSLLYLLPTLMGAMADKTGFRKALILAFALLTTGYFLLGLLPTKSMTILSLTLIMLGGAIIKPVISGTVAKCSDEAHRARAFSIFYWVVNIGAFFGKTVAGQLRESLGLVSINYYAASMAMVGLIWVLLFFKDVDRAGTARSAREIWTGFSKVVRNGRFMALILIVAGFWIIQGQLYASMSKYVLRLLGESAKPEWLANINPFVVVMLVVPVTHMIRKLRPESAIGIGLFIIPLTALCIASAPWVERVTGSSVSLLGLVSVHPITLTIIVGIGLQGFAECFLSPKFLEYASRQAPEGEVALYMGYQHLTTFFAWLFGFAISGHLLDRFCPDPRTLEPEAFAQWQRAIASGGPMPEAYAHYIWLVFAAIGVVAFLALCVFTYVTRRIDARRGASDNTEPRP